MATIVIAANAAGLLLFLRSRTDRLLAAVIDPLHPDWVGMERAFAGFAWYAVSLLGLLAIAATMVVVRIARVRRHAQPLPPRTRLAALAQHGLLAAAVTTAVVLVLIEVLIFQDYGIHFYEFDVIGILADAALRRDLAIQPAEVARVTVAAIALLLAEIVLCYAAAALANWRDGALARACGVALLLGVPAGFVLLRTGEGEVGSGRSELEAALPLGRQLLFRQGSGPHIEVEPRLGDDGYAVLPNEGDFPVIERRRNIVFFVPDGLRADMMQPHLTPNMLGLAAREDALHPQRHFSTGHVSEAGIFGLLYGAPGQAYHSFIAARVSPYPLAVLKRNGYHTFLISSSRLNPYPSDALMRAFDEVAYPANDDDAMQALRAYVERRRTDGRPYFILAFFYTPHFPFTSAKPHLRKYPVVGPKARPDYLNDVIQTDEYFRQILEVIRPEYDQGSTALVVTSDHGEEIRDHGVFGHASATFWNEKIQVPLIMGLPTANISGPAKTPALTSHADIWPTLFDYLRATPRPDPRRYGDGRSLLDTTPPRDRAILVTGRFFPFADRPNVLITGDRKYWFRAPGVASGGRLCVEIARVTDLDDQAVSDARSDPRSAAAFDAMGSTFWRFVRPTGSQTATCPAN